MARELAGDTDSGEEKPPAGDEAHVVAADRVAGGDRIARQDAGMTRRAAGRLWYPDV